MGYALTRAAIKAGHKVTLITAPSSLRPPKNATVIDVVTSGEMFKAVKANFAKCDCLIMAAAVSDYQPAAISKTKIKKEQTVLSLDLKPTKDILKWAGRNKKRMRIWFLWKSMRKCLPVRTYRHKKFKLRNCCTTCPGQSH